MKIQIAKETTIENDNLLVLGQVGSGKSRRLITPIIANTKDINFILLTAKDDGLLDVLTRKQIYMADNKDLKINDFNSNIILNYPMSTNENNNIIEENIRKIINILNEINNEKPIMFIFDGYGLFNFSLTKEEIDKLNEKKIYFTFVLQTLQQVNQQCPEILDICKTYLFLSKENNDLFICSKYKENENDCLKNKICYIFNNNKMIIDEKLEAIDSTRLKFYRIKKGLTQIELAELSGVSLRNIRAIEKDANKVQKLQALNLYKIAKALDCKMEDLLEI